MKLEFSRQIFKKYTDEKFRENPSSESRVVPCRQAGGQTDRHDETNSRFSQFFERAPKQQFFLHGS
jgi:hypothetical protein